MKNQVMSFVLCLDLRAELSIMGGLDHMYANDTSKISKRPQ